MGAESVQDFDDIVQWQLSQGFTSGTNFFLTSRGRWSNYEVELKGYLDNNAHDYASQMAAAQFGGKQGLAAYFDFASITKSGTKFLAVMMSEFDDPQLYGLAGYLGSTAISIPFGQTKSPNLRK